MWILAIVRWTLGRVILAWCLLGLLVGVAFLLMVGWLMSDDGEDR